MKKGFTLVELIAVVSLLGLLLMFTYTKVTDISEKKEKELLENKKTLVINGVKEYMENHSELTPFLSNVYCVKIEDVQDDNLIPIDIDDLLKKYDYVKVTVGSKKNNYDFIKRDDSYCKEL